jgi:hypothetical protein
MLRRATLAVLFLLLLSWPAVAYAQGGDAAAAETLFRQGRAAADSGDYQLACQKFRESNRLDPAPGTVLNIADCEEKLGHIATAWTLFREVTQKLPPSDERSALAAQRSGALEPRLPKLSVHLAAGAPPGSRVFRDGVELRGASLDTALPVDPGAHRLEVRADGRETSTVQIQIAEREKRTQTVAAGAELAESSAAGSTGSSSKRTWGYVLGGVGIAGIGVGAVTGIMVLGKKSTVDDNCDAQKRCNSTGLDAADSGKTLGTISGASFIIGGVALAAGAYLVLSSDGKERPQTALRLGPGGVSVVRSF